MPQRTGFAAVILAVVALAGCTDDGAPVRELETPSGSGSGTGSGSGSGTGSGSGSGTGSGS